MEKQDAVPMTLGQEFSAYAVMIENTAAALEGTGQDKINLQSIFSPPEIKLIAAFQVVIHSTQLLKDECFGCRAVEFSV